MVTRTSQAANLGVSGGVQAAQSNAGYTGADPNAYNAGGIIQRISGASDSSTDRILDAVLGAAGKLAETKWNQSKEEALLSGVQQAGQIQSEDELQSNTFTKNWTTAGYRDTVGRLKAADVEGQIQADSKENAEKSPEEFSDYLAEKRRDLLGSFEGMTLDTRKTMLAQTMMNDRAAIKKQAADHYQFVVDQETKSVQSAVYASNAALNAAKVESPNGDGLAVYGAATQATFSTYLSSIVKNPKLPNSIRGKLLTEAANSALESDNTQLFDMLQKTPVQLADGTTQPMLTLSSPEDQIKLSKAYRESQKRTEVYRAAAFMDDKAKMSADFNNPNTPLLSNEEVNAFADQGMRAGFMNADQFESFKKSYYEAGAKKADQSTLAAAYTAGDQNKFLALGKTSDEALSAYVNTLGRKMSLPEITDKLLVIGNTTGQDNAFKKVGELNKAAFAQLGNRDTIDPANAASAAQIMQKLDASEKNGQAGAFSQFLSAFDAPTQAKIEGIRSELKAGADPVTAISKATANVLADSKLSPAERAALSQSKAADLVKTLDDIEPRSMWGTAVLSAKAMFGSADAAGKLALSASNDNWFADENRANQIMATGKLELTKKMSSIAAQNPSLSTGSVRSMALANLVGRTVSTDWGPLVVPDGFSPQRFFGVSEDVGNDRISTAIKELAHPAEGNKIAFSIGVQGQLMYQELNPSGQPAAPGRTIDPKVVAPIVERQRDAQAKDFNQDYGDGVVKQVGGLSIKFNGDNTANVDNAWMRRMRTNIADHGGVPSVEGNVNANQVSAYFKVATDQAARIASGAMKTTGAPNAAAFNLYSELAYHTNNKFITDKSYRPLLQAIKAKDVDAAQEALKNTPAWKNAESGTGSQEFYLSQLIAAMKG